MSAKVVQKAMLDWAVEKRREAIEAGKVKGPAKMIRLTVALIEAGRGLDMLTPMVKE